MNTVDLLRRLEEDFHETALCVATLGLGDRSVPVEVLALNAHSADLRCGNAISDSGPVTLAIDGFKSFTGELVRRHGRIIGMVFETEETSGTRVAAAPAAPRNAGKKPEAGVKKTRALRRHPRSAVFWSGAVQAGRESIDCIVLNMSPGGAKVKLFRRLAADASPVVLHIDRIGGYAGEVVWMEGDCIGLRFLKDPREVAADIDAALNPSRRPKT